MWSKGINRNIVECKGKYGFQFDISQVVLIETLWNVKYSAISYSPKMRRVLIETLWNVK